MKLSFPAFFLLLLAPLAAFSQNGAAAPADGDLLERPSKLGLGMAIGGNGLLGIPLRMQASPSTFFELGAFFRPVLVLRPNSLRVDDVLADVALSGGVQFMRPLRWHARKDRYISRGFTLRYGRSLQYTTNMYTAGFIAERLRRKATHRSFIFEMGLGLLDERFQGGAPVFDVEQEGWRPIVYWKFHWNSFLNTRPKRRGN
jgi:hypothetical protein